jgi:hypothetical protein
MLVDLGLFLVALLLGLVAAILGRPKPPALDPARLLAVCRSALLWGVEEQAAGSTQAWAERVGAALLYHPAARDGWRKLDEPGQYEIPVPSLPSERALVDDLRAVEPGAPRFQRMFADEAARGALLDDPHGLGDDYDPGRWLGHGCDWESLARWGEPVRAAVLRRLQHHRPIVLAGSDTAEAARALAEGFGEIEATMLALEGTEPTEEAASALAARLRELAPEPAHRLMPLALGDAGPLLLAAMASDPELRDRVVLLVFDGCPMGGVPGDAPPGLSVDELRDQLARQLSQEALDTELRRSTAYCQLGRLRSDAVPAGDGRTPWARQILVEPPVPPSGRRPVAVVDLGVAPAARDLDGQLEARALSLLMSFLLGEGLPRP